MLVHIASRFAAGAALSLTVSAACAGVEPAAGPPVAEAAVPEVRVALARAVSSVEIGSPATIRVEDGAGARLGELPPASSARATIAGEQVVLRNGGTAVGPARVLRLVPADSGTIQVAGRAYRGRVVVEPAASGLLVVNQLDIESYLMGVVNAELGRRGPGEEAATEAQAIVSRTFALRAVGRWRTQGYDLLATVADQAYGGVAAETPAGRAGVAATRGVVLTYGGRPIDAFFHSTCGGRTASGAETFVNGDLPFLQSVPDQGPDGRSWCAISPRYRWREEWTGAALEATLRETLPAAGARRETITAVHDVAIRERTASGRVARLEVHLPGARVPVVGQVIRQVLRPEGGSLLRSTAFVLEVSRGGDRVTRMVAEGQGNGHGVGFCQWGAVGRSRAGYGTEQILAAYYRGVVVERRWR